MGGGAKGPDMSRGSWLLALIEGNCNLAEEAAGLRMDLVGGGCLLMDSDFPAVNVEASGLPSLKYTIKWIFSLRRSAGFLYDEFSRLILMEALHKRKTNGDG